MHFLVHNSTCPYVLEYVGVKAAINCISQASTYIYTLRNGLVTAHLEVAPADQFHNTPLLVHVHYKKYSVKTPQSG